MTRFRTSRTRRAFTLIEVMVAASLLSFGLIVMYGFHFQAIRANKHAKSMTDCTYLAQTQMERLLGLPWTTASRPTQLDDLGSDSTSASDPWAFLPQPNSGSEPSAVNAANGPQVALGPKRYYVTWDIEEMDSTPTWLRVRVRCQYYDNDFSRYHGTTIASYRYRDQ